MQPWTFVIAADMQVGSPESFRYQPAWAENWETAKKQIRDISPDLLLIAGDLVRDGFNRYELEAFKRDVDALMYPVHVVPGNMDTGNKYTDRNPPGHSTEKEQFTDLELNITSRKLKSFAGFFGDLWWSFVHKDVRFSGISDVVLNSGLPEEEAFWHWAEELQDQPPARSHVWIMHYPSFIDRPDEGNWDIGDPEQMQDWYFSIDEPGRSRLIEVFHTTAGREQTIVASGHIHCRLHQTFAGIQYDKAPAVGFPQWADRWEDGDTTLGFLRYDVCDDGIKRTFVPLEKVSDKEGFGPGGHPNPVYYGHPPAWEE